MGASKAGEVELAKVAAPNGRYMSCVLECYIHNSSEISD